MFIANHILSKLKALNIFFKGKSRQCTHYLHSFLNSTSDNAIDEFVFFILWNNSVPGQILASIAWNVSVLKCECWLKKKKKRETILDKPSNPTWFFCCSALWGNSLSPFCSGKLSFLSWEKDSMTSLIHAKVKHWNCYNALTALNCFDPSLRAGLLCAFDAEALPSAAGLTCVFVSDLFCSGVQVNCSPFPLAWQCVWGFCCSDVQLLDFASPGGMSENQ